MNPLPGVAVCRGLPPLHLGGQLEVHPMPSSALRLTARVALSWGGQAQGGAEALWSSRMAYGDASLDVALRSTSCAQGVTNTCVASVSYGSVCCVTARFICLTIVSCNSIASMRTSFACAMFSSWP